MNLGNVLQNHVLLTGLASWILAQALKIPIDLIQNSPLELGLVLRGRRNAQFPFRPGDFHGSRGWVALMDLIIRYLGWQQHWQ